MMIQTKNILLITNSTTDEEIQLIKKAKEQALTKNLHLNISLVHVIPNLPTCYFNIPSMVVLAERYNQEAAKVLLNIGNILRVDKQNQRLISGRVKTEVLRLADKLNIHYILASSTNIRDLHASSYSHIRHDYKNTPIRSIASMVSEAFQS